MLFSCRAQIQGEAAFTKTFQPTLKVSVAIHWLPSHQLHSATGKPFIVTCPIQLAIETRGGNFQHVCSTRYRIFHVENRPELATETRAVFVRHTGRLVDVDSKHASLTDTAKLDLHHLKSARGGHPVRNAAHSIFFKCHESNSLETFHPGA